MPQQSPLGTSKLHRTLVGNLQRILEERGVSVRAVALAGGVNARQLGRVLDFESSPTLSWIETLAEGLEVDPLELLSE